MREGLIAFALADPERAQALVNRAIAKARQSKDGLNGTALMDLMAILTTSWEKQRASELTKRMANLWEFDDED